MQNGADPDSTGNKGNGNGNDSPRLSGMAMVAVTLIIFLSGVVIF